MSRSTLVYLLTFAILIVGLWATLRFGSRLQPRPDLGGVWEIEAEDEDSQAVLGSVLAVEQSGRYYRLRFGSGRAIDLKLAREQVSGEGEDRTVELELVGKGWELTAEGQPHQDEMQMTLKGRTLRRFAARRTQRTYPYERPPAPADEPIEPLEPAARATGPAVAPEDPSEDGPETMAAEDAVAEPPPATVLAAAPTTRESDAADDAVRLTGAVEDAPGPATTPLYAP